jgi:hypothetical protein
VIRPRAWLRCTALASSVPLLAVAAIVAFAVMLCIGRESAPKSILPLAPDMR